MARKITKRQEEVLNTIKNYIDENDDSPTLNELQEILNIATKRGVAKHLEALERKGFLYRTGQTRGIVISDPFESNQMFNIPILGHANAGSPLVFAEEDIVGSITVDKQFISENADNFCLIVKGDSMNMRTVNKVAIADKNYVIVQKNAAYTDGDVVLAVIDNAATIKTYKKSQNSVILYPESTNPVHTPIYLNEDSNGFINGKVIAVLENPTN